MFPRNLTLFRFAPGLVTADELHEAISAHPLREVGDMELATSGFMSPAGEGQNCLTIDCGSSIGALHVVESRIMPASAIRHEVDKRSRAIAEREGRRVGGRERKRIKDDVVNERMPRAMVRRTTCLFWFDMVAGWIMIDTASRKRAEHILSDLRHALGSLPAVPLAPECSPRHTMTDWVAHQHRLPAGISLADSVELRDPADTHGAEVKCRRQALDGDEIGEHLRSGKQVFELGLEFDGRLGFRLGEDLTLRGLHFYDVVTDELEASNADGADDEIQARFALFTLELQRVAGWLDRTFRLAKPSRADLETAA